MSVGDHIWRWRLYPTWSPLQGKGQSSCLPYCHSSPLSGGLCESFHPLSSGFACAKEKGWRDPAPLLHSQVSVKGKGRGITESPRPAASSRGRSCRRLVLVTQLLQGLGVGTSQSSLLCPSQSIPVTCFPHFPCHVLGLAGREDPGIQDRSLCASVPQSPRHKLVEWEDGSRWVEVGVLCLTSLLSFSVRG